MLVNLPSNEAAPDGIWRPRDHQAPGWNYLLDGGKRLVEIDHRRAGKDEMALAWACVAMHNRVGSYWHLLPEQAQGRKAIWAAVDPHRGKRRIDLAFPESIRRRTLDNEMFIELKNGSTWQVLGSDRYDSLVGTPPVGLVFSEFAIANPQAWAYLRPILLENNGWAVFITTPRGRNHLYKMFKFALEADNDWLAVMNKADETTVFTPAQLKEERREYVAQYGKRLGEAMFNQEYLCSFESAIPGAYYAEELNELERAGRLCDVPFDDTLPVITAYDIGMNDATVRTVWQVAGSQIRLIDTDTYHGTGLAEQIKDLKAKPYWYACRQHIYPFDINVQELGTGTTRRVVLNNLGIRVSQAPKLGIMEGIDAFRRLIPRLWIDKANCGELIEVLKGYRAAWDADLQTLRQTPLHSFESNAADSCRYFAVTPWQSDDWSEIDYSDLDRAAG